MQLKAWRARNGITLAQLAESCGLSHSTISLIENGRRGAGKLAAQKIEIATNGEVTAAELMGLTDTRDVSESAVGFACEKPQRSKLETETVEPQLVTVAVPGDLLDLSRQYGLNVEALLAAGGLPALKAAAQKAFFEAHREAIEWTRNYVETHGTPSEQLGMI